MMQKNTGSKKVRAGDNVVVIAGNNKGQSGKVLSCTGDKVLIQGINLCKKHVKRSEQNPKGGVVEVERPVHVSNVRPCDDAGKPVKLSVRIADKSKELVYTVDGKSVVWRSMKQKGKV